MVLSDFGIHLDPFQLLRIQEGISANDENGRKELAAHFYISSYSICLTFYNASTFIDFTRRLYVCIPLERDSPITLS
jgi:hypothetical protein